MRSAVRLLVLLLVAVAAIGSVAWWTMIRMPGKSFRGEIPALNPDETALRDELRRDVRMLAGEIGERNFRRYGALMHSADFIERSLAGGGLRPVRQSYTIGDQKFDNIETEIPGRTPNIIVIGAHYDSVVGSAGANDNASGVAAMLALARRFAAHPPGTNTVRFVAFVNEEPPFFHSKQMGSWVYAHACKTRGDNIIGMLSLETIGYYTDEPRTQIYPLPALGMFYPTKGNFIGFAANLPSRGLLRRVIREFRANAKIPSEGVALPSAVPGISWSDQWAFWEHGYPAVMVTDTALFRDPNYHSEDDTPDKLNYDRFALTVSGLEKVIADLAGRR